MNPMRWSKEGLFGFVEKYKGDKTMSVEVSEVEKIIRSKRFVTV